MVKDYRKYSFSKKEFLTSILEGLLINAGISFLFFNSIYAMIPGVFTIVLYIREKKKKLVKARMHELRVELKEFLNSLIVVLQTGRSFENAFFEALKDTENYLKKDTLFLQEIQRICGGISVGESLEKQLSSFAERSHLEELEYFSQVFSVGKRSGGNIIAIMKHTIHMLQDRMDAQEEIETVIAEKQMEFQIMSVIPMLMIVYLRISAGDFLDCLYGNVTGIVIMSICLAIYGGCYFYGKKLLEFAE